MERGAETGRDKGPKRNAQLQCLCFDNGAAARGEDKHENTEATTGTSLRQSARLLTTNPQRHAQTLRRLQLPSRYCYCYCCEPGIYSFLKKKKTHTFDALELDVAVSRPNGLRVSDIVGTIVPAEQHTAARALHHKNLGKAMHRERRKQRARTPPENRRNGRQNGSGIALALAWESSYVYVHGS